MRRGFIYALAIVSCVLASAVSAQDREIESLKPPSHEEVQVPQVTVIGSSIKPRGTGTLHVDQPSPSASRLGLSIREIPASVEIVDQTLLQ
ncbi:MAG: hypothetical protein WBK08_13865, partial [Nitrospira sp.]